jgi:hypothetical protein
MHNDGYFELRDHYLKQSQKSNSQITTADWIKSFTRFARELGYELDTQSLNNLAIV